MKVVIPAVIASMLCAAPSFAADFLYVSGKDAAATVSKFTDGTAIHSLIDNPNYGVELVARIKSGPVETHDHSVDHMVVLEGAGTITVGGTVKDNKDIGGGQWRGVSSSGGKSYPLTPGAVVTIPAGMPHWTQVPKGGHVKIVVFKTPN